MTHLSETIIRAKRVLEIEINELIKLMERLDESFFQAVQILQSAVEKKKKAIILGVGKSGHIGEKIAATLTSTGVPAVSLNSLNALHGDLGLVSDGDVIIILSYSGETEELIRILPAIMRFDIKIIAFTGKKNSTLSKSSAVILDVSVSREACPHNLAPTSSTTVMLALGDAIAMVLLENRGFTRENFARFHPAGHLGKTILLKVSDIMRKEEEIVIVTGDNIVADVLKQLTLKRSGAAIIVDANGLLAGIFTHGDFSRYYSVNPLVGQLTVGSVMTTCPISIHVDHIAAEVLMILQQHRIDDIIVVNSFGKPVGIVDSQDLSRFKLF